LEDVTEQKDRADKTAEDLRVALDDLTEQNTRAETELQRSRRLLYVSQIASGQREWTLGDASLAWHYLDSCRWDLRGWEHDYLYSLITRVEEFLAL
jgi:hypothetical protein